MNDLDFIKNFDQDLGQKYEEAKRFYLHTPTHSLIILRGFIVDFTQLVAKNYKIDLQKTYLYKKIEQLNIVKKIDKNICSTLHQIRVDSNQGAHFEKSNLSLDEFVHLAKINLKRACSLVELYYLNICSKEVPVYKFLDTSNDITKQTCYEAIMNDDINAQYLLGLNLQAKAKLAHLNEYKELKKSGEQYFINPNSFRLLEQSTFWFKQAAQDLNHEEAVFEFAMCLLYGEGIEKNAKEGERLINLAAEKKSINAQAILGAFYLEGSLLYEKDYEKAKIFLQTAAKEEHPEALTNLSYMYSTGIGVKKDLNLSFKYMQKASYAGFSHAQYHLSNFYFNSIGTVRNPKKALELLEQSFNNDYSPAILTKARLLLKGEFLAKDLEKSQSLFIYYIELENDFEVLFELANYYMDELKGYKDISHICSLLENCKNNSGDISLKEKASDLLKSLLSKHN